MSPSKTAHFVNVTEISGEEISYEQLERLCHRYYWASGYCNGKDVLEVACGAGVGLPYLMACARSIAAGDVSPEVLVRAKLPDNIRTRVFDAEKIPFPNQSFDVVILFEAIYYIPSGGHFVAEAARVLRPGGMLLVATANKDLYDFNPSPHSFTYYGVTELRDLLRQESFESRFFGYLRVDQVSLRQKILRPIKAAAVALNLVPETMAGKQLLKRIVFGRPVTMPTIISNGMVPYDAPELIEADTPDYVHKVIYCAAKKS